MGPQVKLKWVTVESNVRKHIRAGKLHEALLVAEAGVTGAPHHRTYIFRKLVKEINTLLEADEQEGAE